MTPAQTLAAPAPSPGFLSGLKPPHVISALITLILVTGEVQYGVLGGMERLALTLGTCLVTEFALSWFILGHRPASLLSAYISGISLSLLLKPLGGLYWPFVLGGLLSIGSKYVLRYGGKHLWNPTNFGVGILILIAGDRVAILSHEWGNELRTDAVIWAVGLVVASKAKVLHITLTYAASFVALAWLRSSLDIGKDLTFTHEVAPLSAAMYQLFCFFMITDPATVLAGRRVQLAVAVSIALFETVLRMSNDLNLAWAAPFASAPAIYALFTVGPVALFVQRWRAIHRSPAAPAVA